MARKAKGMGAVLGIVLAISVVAATGAQAAAFHSEIANTSVRGVQATQNVLTTTAGTVKCETVELSGMATTAEFSEIVFEPTYSGCKAFGQTATVSMNGCKWTFTPPTPTSLIEWHWIPHIGCFPGNHIVVSVPAGNCTLEIGEQIPGGVIEGKNEGSGTTRSILATAALTEIAYTVAGTGTICGSKGAHTDGKYSGTISFKGYESTAFTTQRGLWIE